MLRRPPTTIQITAEDVANYEDRQAREMARQAAQQARDARKLQKQMQQHEAGSPTAQQDPAIAAARAQAAARRARDQRIGVARGGRS